MQRCQHLGWHFYFKEKILTMIYFIRHGATDWNDNINSLGIKDPKLQGRMDIPLNKNGIKQAKETAKTINKIKFDIVLCSPLIRAKQTCEIVYNGKTPIKIDDRLIERDFGEFEGLTRSEFDFNGFWNSHSNQHFKKAESIGKLKKRVFNLLEELKQYKDKNILLVSHGGVGCVLTSYFKGEPENGNYLNFELPNGKPVIFDYNEII